MLMGHHSDHGPEVNRCSSSPNSVPSLNSLGGCEASSGSPTDYVRDPVKTTSSLGVVSLPL